MLPNQMEDSNGALRSVSAGLGNGFFAVLSLNQYDPPTVGGLWL